MEKNNDVKDIKLCSERELKWRRRLAEAKEWIDKKVDYAIDWAEEHKEAVAAVAVPIIIGGGKELYKTIKRNKRIAEEKELKDLYIYDRSTGHYWKTKRELSTYEWQEFERRKKAGEGVGKILESMHVLKR